LGEISSSSRPHGAAAVQVRVHLRGQLPRCLQGGIQIEPYFGQHRQIRPEPGQHEEPINAVDAATVLRQQGCWTAGSVDALDAKALRERHDSRLDRVLRP
jgi:hypothetical protein